MADSANQDGSTPVEHLEVVAAEVRAGARPMADLIDAFLGATVVVPSGVDPTREPLQPVLVDVGGIQHVAVFASLPAAQQTAGLAPYAVSLSGRDVVRAVQPGAGVLVGTVDSGFDLSPSLLDEIRTRQG